MSLDDLIVLSLVHQYLPGAVRDPWFPMACHGSRLLKHVHAKNPHLCPLQSQGVHVKRSSVSVFIVWQSTSSCHGDIVSRSEKEREREESKST